MIYKNINDVSIKLCKKINPTSPLGLGGLANQSSNNPLHPFFPFGEGFTPPPTPALENPPLSREERKEKEVEVCVCSGVVLAAFNLKMEA